MNDKCPSRRDEVDVTDAHLRCVTHFRPCKRSRRWRHSRIHPVRLHESSVYVSHFYYHLISLSDHRNNQRSHKQFIFIDCIHRSDSESPPLGLTSAAIFIAYFHMKFIHTIKKSRWTLFLPSCWILTSLNYISHLILIPENEKFHTFLAYFQTPLPYHAFYSLDSFIRELELKFLATSLLRFKSSEMYFIFYLRSWIWEISHLFGLFPNAVTLSFLHSIYWFIFRNQSSSSQLLLWSISSCLKNI